MEEFNWFIITYCDIKTCTKNHNIGGSCVFETQLNIDTIEKIKVIEFDNGFVIKDIFSFHSSWNSGNVKISDLDLFCSVEVDKTNKKVLLLILEYKNAGNDGLSILTKLFGNPTI